MSDDKEVNFDAIAVKDFLTEDEAAAYCGVSPSAFQRGASSEGIRARRFLWRKLYAKSELFNALDRAPQWLQSTGRSTGGMSKSGSPAPTRTSTGLKGASSGAHSARLRPERLKPFAPRKRQNSGSA